MNEKILSKGKLTLTYKEIYEELMQDEEARALLTSIDYINQQNFINFQKILLEKLNLQEKNYEKTLQKLEQKFLTELQENTKKNNSWKKELKKEILTTTLLVALGVSLFGNIFGLYILKL